MDSKNQYNSPFQATLKGIRDLYSKKKDVVLLPTNLSLEGRTVLITGASSGLGFATAKRLAKAGARVIMVVRSGIPEKGEAVKHYSASDEVLMYYADLSDFESIKTCLDAMEKDRIGIDTVISNAAVVPLKSRKSPQGLEEMFMVNYLSAFYLLNQLLDRKILCPDGTAIIVSSESHRNPDQFDWDAFGVFHQYGIGETVARYGYFKLLLTTFANELKRRKTALKVNVLCPGPVNSNIAREAPSWMKPLLKLAFSIFFRSPEKASDPIMYFVSRDGHLQQNVDYLFLMQPKEMDEKALDPLNGKKLWERSLQLILPLR